MTSQVSNKRALQAQLESLEAARATAEAALLESEDRFGRIFEAAPIGIVNINAAGQIVRVNPAAVELFGYSEAELQQIGLSTISHPDDTDESCRLFTELTRGERSHFQQEKRYFHKNGQVIWTSLSVAAVRNPSGAMLYTISMFQDISARKTAEAQRAQMQAEQQARAVAETARQRMAFLAEASRVLSASLDYHETMRCMARLVIPTLADWCTVLVMNEQEASSFVELAHRDLDCEPILQALVERFPLSAQAATGAAVLRQGVSQLYPLLSNEALKRCFPDEEHRQLLRQVGLRSLMIVPLSARGHIVGALTFARISDSAHYSGDDLALAEELAQRAALAIDNARLYSEAQQALQARDQFLSIAAHELKTPITALLGYAQLLDRRLTRTGLDARDQRSLRALAEQARRLNRLSHALLDISRIQLGRLSIDRAPFNLVDLTRRVVGELAEITEQHNVILNVPGEPIFLSGDELRLEQVLQNLIQNAIKYSPEGGAVRVTLTSESDQAHISVADEGLGIPAAEMERLFTAYFRASNSRSEHISGMGLGLYVVREIVTLHGGTVSVESLEGCGTTFTVRLPLCAGNSEAEASQV